MRGKYQNIFLLHSQAQTQISTMDPENSGSVSENSKVARSLKTAPFTGRFPNQRQEKYCWAAYVQFNKCSAAKSEDDEECVRYKHYFRSLCPNEWVNNIIFCFMNLQYFFLYSLMGLKLRINHNCIRRSNHGMLKKKAIFSLVRFNGNTPNLTTTKYPRSCS